jgi:hypothetical protein
MLSLTMHLQHFCVGDQFPALLEAPTTAQLQALSKSRAVHKQNLEGATFSGAHDVTLRDLDLPNIELTVIRAAEVVIRPVLSPTRSTATTFFRREKGNSRQHPVWRAFLKLIDEREWLHLRFNVKMTGPPTQAAKPQCAVVGPCRLTS